MSNENLPPDPSAQVAPPGSAVVLPNHNIRQLHCRTTISGSCTAIVRSATARPMGAAVQLPLQCRSQDK